MRRLGFILLVLFALFASSLSACAREKRSLHTEEILHSELPKEGRATLALIKQGGPFPHKRDGIVFGNFEKRLPMKKRGYYREYTVPTPGARDRGARRIVAGDGGEYYYTADHYKTFQRIRE